MRTLMLTKIGRTLAALALALATLAVASLLLFRTPSASAEAGTVTQTVRNVTESFDDVLPCAGGPAHITITYNAVFHVTELPNETFHVTFTQTGTFVAEVPGNAASPYTGHFTIWDGDNGNQRNQAGTMTALIHGTGADGSTLAFHAVEHFSVSASGVVIAFDNLSCA